MGVVKVARREPPAELVATRASIEQNMSGLPQPEGTTARDATLGGVRAVECRPEGGGDGRTILYFHGGGFRLGSGPAWRVYCSHLAKASDATVYAVDYRLAPEHPFPAAVDDCVAVYRAVSGPVVLAGDSAGGNLAAATALALADAGDALPAGIVCCSPWADLTNSAETYTTRAGVDNLFSLDSATTATELYLDEGEDPKQALVSPVFGDWAGAPPVLIQVGDHEVLLDDARNLADAMRSAGVDVRHHVFPEMPHVWQLGYPDLPQAVEAVDEIAAFVKEVTQ